MKRFVGNYSLKTGLVEQIIQNLDIISLDLLKILIKPHIVFGVESSSEQFDILGV